MRSVLHPMAERHLIDQGISNMRTRSSERLVIDIITLVFLITLILSKELQPLAVDNPK